MADKKRYYWLKLKRDFFKRHDIRIVEAMPNGKEYVLFYLKLLIESIDHEGQLRFNELIPYSPQMLSVITDTNIDIVKSALEILQQLKLVEIMDDSTLYMSEIQKMVGCETEEHEKEMNRLRQERYRERQKALCNGDKALCNGDVTENNAPLHNGEKDKENRVRDKSKRESVCACARTRDLAPSLPDNVMLTVEELEEFKEAYPTSWEDKINHLSEYLKQSGKDYKDHFSVLKAWAREDAQAEAGEKADKSYDLDDFFKAAVRKKK